MRRAWSSTVLCGAVLALIIGTAAVVVAAPGDEDWDQRFYLKGGPGPIPRCAALGPKGDLYVAGLLTTVDNIVVNHVAKWDGSAWHRLGRELDASVRTMVFDPAGLLYIGGVFTDAAGDPDADAVAVWNGNRWVSLGGPGSGLDGTVLDLAFGPTGHLYAGGSFSDVGGDPDADNIAVWDGATWSSLGGAGSGVNGPVRSIAFSPAGTLVIGGLFTDAGGSVNTGHIAAWIGGAWAALGGGLDDQVRDIAFAADGDLYAGGDFRDAGGDPYADSIAVYRRSSWKSLGGSGSELDDTVRSIIFDASGTLYAGGAFTDAGADADADRVARWTASGWAGVGPHSGLSNVVTELIVDNSGALVVLGGFTGAGGDPSAHHLARWSGSAWRGLSSAAVPNGFGLTGAVYALAVDEQQRLYVGGDFRDAGGDPAGDYLARWDPSGWSAVTHPGGPSPLDWTVLDLTFTDDGNLLVGGNFSAAGGDPNASYIAVTDGEQWSSLGGPGSGLNGGVAAIVVADDGRIYAGGGFSDAGGDPDADHVAVWDGASWSSLSGPRSRLGDSVYSLALDRDGNLYAGGFFQDAGGDPDADLVAMWNGSSWQPLGAPLTGSYVDTLLIDSGRVYVGGNFQDAGGIPQADYIAKWDAMGWNALGTGLNNVVRALVRDGAGKLYAVGEFAPQSSDPLHPSRIAVWDGSAWSGLGSGLDGTLAFGGVAIVHDGGSKLYVGGGFSMAGGKASNAIGCYTTD